MIPPVQRFVSESDFEQMVWHDTAIHGLCAIPDDFELCFDIDLFCNWAYQGPGFAQYLLAPTTMVFANASHVRLAVASQQGSMFIQSVTWSPQRPLRGATVNTWRWQLTCDEGEIEFEASGFELFLRAPPVISDLQYLHVKTRGSPAFGRVL